MEPQTPPDTARRNEAAARSFASLSELRDFCASIGQGWFRCQALALGAVSLPDDADVIAACSEAESAARSETDAYKQVACLAWPIAALVARGLNAPAAGSAARAIAAAERVTPSGSRAEAWMMLLNAVWPLGDGPRRSIYHGLFLLLESDPHWRVVRSCRDAVLFYPDDDQPAWLGAILESCTNDQLLRRIERDRTATLRPQPRTLI